MRLLTSLVPAISLQVLCPAGQRYSSPPNPSPPGSGIPLALMFAARAWSPPQQLKLVARLPGVRSAPVYSQSPQVCSQSRLLSSQVQQGGCICPVDYIPFLARRGCLCLLALSCLADLLKALELVILLCITPSQPAAASRNALGYPLLSSLSCRPVGPPLPVLLPVLYCSPWVLLKWHLS